MNLSNFQLRLKILERFGSQANFAQKAGIDSSRLSNILNGRFKLGAKHVPLWLSLLECDSEDLRPLMKEVCKDYQARRPNSRKRSAP